MVRSSSLLPPIVRRLLWNADQRVGEGVSEKFLRAHERVDSVKFFDLAMLRQRQSAWVRKHVSQLEPSRTSALQFENRGDSDTVISMSVRLNAGSVRGLFEQFIRVTSHSNSVGDFRSVPERYAPILLGPRYFVFHGDGHCVQLANLFAALLGRLTQAEFLVRYVANESASFRHAFIEWIDAGERFIVDPDQKVIATWDDSLYPSGMVFQLLSLGGEGAFADLGEGDRDWLFSRSTREVYAEFGFDVPQPRIYRERPHPAEIGKLFREARAWHIETVSLQADDYAWKRRFREATKNEALLSALNQTVGVTLAPGSVLSFGLDVDDLPKEAGLFPLLFFGRVPAVIRVVVPEGGVVRVKVPERPWFCCFENLRGGVVINDHQVRPRPSGKFQVVGAGQMEDIVDEPGIAGSTDLVVEAAAGAVLRVVLPFNALAFNNGIIRFEGDTFALAAEELH